MLEANERRRALLLQGERPRGARIVVGSLGSVAMWVREHPVRLAAASAVALLGIAGLADPSSVTDDELRRPPIAALPETGQGNPAATVTVTLSSIRSESDGEPDGDPDAEADGEPGAEADGEPGAEPGGAPAAASDAPVAAASRDQEQVTADPDRESAPAASPGPVATGTAPEPEPELSDTGEPDDPPVTEPEPADPPESEPSDNDEPDQDDADETCLGVNALGLTVNLCLPPLLGL